MSYHSNRDLHPVSNNPYKLNYGNIELFIEDLTRFMDDWYMVPTDIMDALEETHITTCKIRWPEGDIPNNVSDFRIKKTTSKQKVNK